MHQPAPLTVVMARRSSWSSVTDTDELIGVFHFLSALPQYLPTDMVFNCVSTKVVNGGGGGAGGRGASASCHTALQRRRRQRRWRRWRREAAAEAWAGGRTAAGGELAHWSHLMHAMFVGQLVVSTSRGSTLPNPDMLRTAAPRR